jgi:hypothetical protein
VDDIRDIVAAVSPYLSDALVSPASRADLESLARLLPRHLAGLCLECRLGESEARADLSLRFGSADGGREILAGRGHVAGPSAGLLGHPIWARVHRFSREWVSPRSALYTRLADVWLEFDVAGLPPRVPLPSVFLLPADVQHSNERPSTFAGTATDLHHMMVRTALPILTGSAVPEGTDQKLLHCLTHLPTGSRLYSLGVMLARRARGIRFSAIGIPPSRVPDYLRRVGWPGAIQEIEDIISRFAGLADLAIINLDIEDTVQPGIGLEFSFRRRAEPDGDPRFALFGDLLVDAGLCLPDKRAGVLAWPGCAPDMVAPWAWPESLVSTSFGSLTVSSIVNRALSHFKLSYHPDRPLQAKAYLSCRVKQWQP